MKFTNFNSKTQPHSPNIQKFVNENQICCILAQGTNTQSCLQKLPEFDFIEHNGQLAIIFNPKFFKLKNNNFYSNSSFECLSVLLVSGVKTIFTTIRCVQGNVFSDDDVNSLNDHLKLLPKIMLNEEEQYTLDFHVIGSDFVYGPKHSKNSYMIDHCGELFFFDLTLIATVQLSTKNILTPCHPSCGEVAIVDHFRNRVQIRH